MKSIHILALACLALALPIAHGHGSLTPPGPPGPTMKTLDEIEPRIPLSQSKTPGDSTCVFKITQPGSYMMTGNLKPPVGKHGILIALLVPGVVEVDMMGFTIDGSDTGAGTSAALCNNENVTEFVMRNGTVRNFAGDACLATSTSCSFVFHTITFLGGAGGVNTAGRLRMADVSVSGGTGIPVQMGDESELSNVSIKAGIPKIIGTTGSRHRLSNVTATSFSFGASQTGSAITLGPDSTVNGLRVRISDATYTGPVLGNSSGFTEVSGLTQELMSVTAPSAYLGWAMVPQLGDTGTHERSGSMGYLDVDANNAVVARNCSFSIAVGIISSGCPIASYAPRIRIEGTTIAPAVLRVDNNHCTIAADITLATTTSITGGIISVYGGANTISSTIRGILGTTYGGNGSMAVRIYSGVGCSVQGCVITGRNDGPIEVICLDPGVTNTLVCNNRATGLAPGSTFVDNDGGSTNSIAPIVNASNIATNTNPMANILH